MPPINPLNDPYVLEGRIVTMDDQSTILDNGAIYIAKGIITAVQPVFEDPPAGFEKAKRINTGDTIYPGLIELHNHLSYNAIPLWDVPQKYANNGQWRGIDAYRRQITKPSQVLGGTDGIIEALVRYVEMRALLGGVTTSQGISLSSSPRIKRYYKGIVRNVEQPLNDDLPAAGTKIGNPNRNKTADYLKTLNKKKCYLQHLSEGTDKTARGWFLGLKMDNGEWALNEAFCGIHSTALKEEDFQIIADHGGSMVWSPLSNYLLYGATANLLAAKNSGVDIGLGSDWAPSGSKNLLGELKVAWLASQAQGNIFSPEDIVAMVTRNPARIASWDEHLGTIKAGNLADLIAINGQQGDDYMRLIEARETSITMTIIDGVPRVGQKRLMKDFGPGTENIHIGRSERVLNLTQADADPLVGQLSLAEATSRLKNAMANLPSLAMDLDNALAEGFAAGSLDNEGAHWHIDLDLAEDDLEIESAQGVSSKPLSFYITEPMELEDITVVDDRTHLRKLIAARNLPEFIKTGLPPLYGETIPLPEAGHFLQQTKEQLAPELLQTTRDLSTFLRTSGELNLDDRKRIVQQAMLVLEENYVHLPLKRAMHAADPMQQLRLLQHRLDVSVEGEVCAEIEFHNEISRIFNSLRDLHTRYRLPRPFLGKSAWLPFIIERIFENGRQKYIVSKLIGDAGPDSFKIGVIVTHWNGVPIHQAVLHNAEHHAGSNEAARHAHGLNSLTIRPLAHGLPPEEEWVTLRYVDEHNHKQEWSQAWLVFEPGLSRHNVLANDDNKELSALGLDDSTDDIQQSKKVLYVPSIVQLETATNGKRREIQGNGKTRATRTLETFLPGIFKAKEIHENGKKYGYIRIYSFNTRDADVFVDEFIRLTEHFSNKGLIIDVRDNGGGLIYAAEQLLQVLTPMQIEPERAQFINSPLNLAICRNHKKSSHFPGLELGSWISSISQSVETGATYSLGYPITDAAKCNNIGQRYFGPVVLIVDPLCYSATDIFAAGFKDHNIGPIIGVGANTGAGGANVWSHGLLSRLMQPDQVEEIDSPYLPLPRGADLRVAIRRTVRVGPNAGNIVEDLGIKPDFSYHMTRQDVLDNNTDLIKFAVTHLANRKSHTLKLALEEREVGLPAIRISTHNVDRVDTTIGNSQIRSHFPHAGVTYIELQDELGDINIDNLDVELRGYKNNQLVGRRHELISLPTR
ncbi:MAG: amidohydrolase family protein [Gammaproteobacteria bacterium]|nr:amidohydrolase family protein [Gammaproteobacteria bacterium]